jgi:hypothetical protein
MQDFGMGGMGGGIGGAAGGIASGLYGLFGASNPYDAGQQYYGQIPGMLQQYLGKYANQGDTAFNNQNYYMNQGQQAGGTLSDQLNGLVNDPTAKMRQWGSTFQASPGFNWQVGQATGAANRAAAAGGMAGSPMEQQQLATTVNGLANQDYYNYLNHAQDLYGSGIAGLQNQYNMGGQIGQNMYNTAAQMTNSLAQNLGAAYMNQGNQAESGSNWDNQNTAGSLGSIAGGAATLAAFL